MTRLSKQLRSITEFLHSRLFAVSIFFIIIAGIIVTICEQTRAVVCVTAEAERSLQFVMESDARQLNARFVVQPGMRPLISRVSSPSDHYAEFVPDTSVTATITVDGKTISRRVPNGTTVGELLHKEGITYDGNDLLTPAAEKPIVDGESITLKRVLFQEYTIDNSIPYKIIRKHSSLLGPGRTKVLQEGSTGLRTRTYARCTIDGRQEEIQFIGEKISKHAVDQIILIGGNKAVSPLNFDFEVDENGTPLHYKEKFTNQVATGYSARPGALTASGRQAVVGTVAVNPNRIPYGSKLYITSADGQFVYGCAIAADTGTGLMQGIIDVDLFYDTYNESVLNGRRIVDIYVLE